MLYSAADIAGYVGEGLFSHVVDIAIWNAVFLAHISAPQSTSGQAWRASHEADRFTNQWNYETIKEAIARARRNRLLRPATRTRHTAPEITEEGKKRLAALLPVYDEKRIWDGRMHLITYDVPEKKRLDRELLRDAIRTLGAGRLQDSVWITPYNPIDTLRTFIEEHQLAGSVIVSDMGEGGAIGEEDIQSLAVPVWGLDKLNDRYEEWLHDQKRSDSLDQWLITGYLAILRDDPQLPFALLPKWWKGNDVYRLVAPKLKLLSFALRPQQ